MKILLTLLLAGLTFTGYAQERKFLDQDHKPVTDSALAVYYTETTMTDSVAGVEKVFFKKTGRPKSETSYSNYRKKVWHGPCRSWYENGHLATDGNYRHGKLDGQLKTYYKIGSLRRADVYAENNLVEGKCFTRAGADTAYFAFEVMPQFPGGNQAMARFLSKNIKYPKSGLKNKITGQVVSSFVVDKEGKIISAEILKSLGPDFDREVLRIIGLMPAWKPGMHEGENVKVRFNLPVRFSI